MFIISFEGGLGNQLFQYAFGRYMEEKFHEEIKYDISNYYYDEREIRDFLLKDFDISKNWEQIPIKKNRFSRYGIRYLFYIVLTFPYTKIDNFLLRRQSDKRQKFSQFYQKCINVIGFYRIHCNTQHEFLIGPFKKKYIRGQWMRPEIVKSVDPLLKNELKYIVPLSVDERDWLNRITNSNSVAVHIRRGDYVNLGMVTCDINYYLRCMKYISNIVEKSEFFIFSDDIEWVREELKRNNDFDFFSFYLMEERKPTTDLMLMYSCKHFIMSNSTFSWWAAYLGNFEGKIVLTPKKWWPDAKEKCEYVLSEWIEIEN